LDSTDKDFRYMALSDLFTELGKDSFKVDTDNEKKLVTKLLTMVADDSSGDVKGFAVKWYVTHLISFYNVNVVGLMSTMFCS
jgi:hypothetical protein